MKENFKTYVTLSIPCDIEIIGSNFTAVSIATGSGWTSIHSNQMTISYMIMITHCTFYMNQPTEMGYPQSRQISSA